MFEIFHVGSFIARTWHRFLAEFLNQSGGGSIYRVTFQNPYSWLFIRPTYKVCICGIVILNLFILKTWIGVVTSIVFLWLLYLGNNYKKYFDIKTCYKFPSNKYLSIVKNEIMYFQKTNWIFQYYCSFSWITLDWPTFWGVVNRNHTHLAPS